MTPADMISLENALGISGRFVLAPGEEEVALGDAQGRILAETIRADRDIPPFNRSAMDGYACRREDLGNPLQVVGTFRAGDHPDLRIGRGECTGIATGGMVPEGADCVVMKEHVEQLESGVIRYSGGPAPDYISEKGEDIRKGDPVLAKGTRIGPQQMGLIATFGKMRFRVVSRLRIGLLATGNELIEPDNVPGRSQIRNSNGWQLSGQIRSAGHEPVYLGIVRDDLEQTGKAIEAAFSQTDLVLLTGGASVGEFDMVRDALAGMGFTIEFDKVAIQPGKPYTFATRQDRVCLGLSGNPVSCFVQFELLVKPFLAWSSGTKQRIHRTRLNLAGPFERTQSNRRLFLPMVLEQDGRCRLLEYHGSAHLHALDRMSGFAEIPIGVDKLEKGEEVDVRFV